ncbi:uncharacterized protein LOC143470062 isoform X2 [Clavelina lepadiformis]|uniref:uncharacterized protein LOC143470062 isoform X2 n=1 Tax=Clavelina lepadiformis TaxID=159417 RepID=UPI004042C15F
MLQVVEELIDLLSITDSSPAIQKLQVQLISSRCSDAERYSCVYAIFHHSTLALNQEISTNDLSHFLKISIKCLEYLVSQWKEESKIPQSGLEKLIYHLVKHVCLNYHLTKINEVLLLLLKLLHRQKSRNQQVVQYISAKIRNLTLPMSVNICACHKSHCHQITFAKCKFHGNVLSMFSDPVISFSPFFRDSMSTIFILLNSCPSSCHCHNKLIVDSFHDSVQIVTRLVGPGEDDFRFIDEGKSFLGSFLQLYGASSTCSDCPQVTSDITLIVETMLRSLSSIRGLFSSTFNEDKSISCVVICKVLGETMKLLTRFVSSSENIVSASKWETIVPRLYEACRELTLIQGKLLSEDVFRKLMYLFYKLVQAFDSKALQRIILSSALEAFQDNILPETTYDNKSLAFLLDYAANLCIVTWNNLNGSELPEALLLMKSAFENSIRFHMVEQVVSTGTALSKMLRKLSSYDDAMANIGKAVEVLCDNPQQLEVMVTQWLRCKTSLLMTSSDSTCESRTVADDMSSNIDKQKLVIALVCQLEICRSSLYVMECPPHNEFHILVKLLDLCDPGSSIHTTSTLLMALLLHGWSDLLQYDRDASSMISELCDSTSEFELDFEVKFLAEFLNYICSWESTLSKIWKNVSVFESQQANPSSANLLRWFPSSPPTDLSKLVPLINALSQCSDIKPIFLLDFVQACRALAIILELRGEETLLLVLLKELVRILELEPNQGDDQPLIKFHLASFKSRLSFLLCHVGLLASGLEESRDADKLMKDLVHSEKWSKMESQISIEAKCSLAKALVFNHKYEESCKVIEELRGGDFIKSAQQRSSRSSTFAAARVDLLLSQLNVALLLEDSTKLTDVHTLYQMVASLRKSCVVLGQSCPGLCTFQKSFEVPGGNNTSPNFGRKSKDSNTDMIFQFEVLELFLKTLYLASKLWLLAGDLRCSLLYITDGIVLTRSLCLPERELQFQLLLASYAAMECNTVRLAEELQVARDVLKYIGCNEAKTNWRRTKLHSTRSVDETSSEFDRGIEQAINNSSVMEEIQPDDHVSMATVDMNMTSSFSVTKNDAITSPELSRKRGGKKSRQHHQVFAHEGCCSCIFCSNIFIVRQQCNLVQLTAQLIELTAEGDTLTWIDRERKIFSNISNHLSQVISACWKTKLEANVFMSEELRFVTLLAQINLKHGNRKISRTLAYTGLQQTAEMPRNYENLWMMSRLHLVAGQLLTNKKDFKKLDTRPYLDSVIDCLAKNNKLPEFEYDLTGKMKGLSLIATPAPKLQKNKENKKVKTSKPSNEITDLNSRKVTLPTKPLSNNRALTLPRSFLKTPKSRRGNKNKNEKLSELDENTDPNVKSNVLPSKPSLSGGKDSTPLTSLLKTPRSKRIATSVKKSTCKGNSTRKTEKAKNLQFEIFNDDAPDIKLDTVRKKKTTQSKTTLPKPDLDQLGDEYFPIITSTAKSKKTRRVILSPSDDDDDDDDEFKCNVKTSQVRTRSSARIATNLQSARKSARRRHRAEEGPYYTDEDTETSRHPIRQHKEQSKNTRRVNNQQRRVLKEVENVSEMPDQGELMRDGIPPEWNKLNEIERVRERHLVEERDVEFLDNENIVASTPLAVDKLPLNDSTSEDHFNRAFNIATALADFQPARASSQLLSTLAHQSKNLSKAAACHASSVGTSLRIITALHMKYHIRSVERLEAASEDDFTRAIRSSINSSHPSKVISSLRHPEQFMDDVISKIPPDWTVCIVSLLEGGSRRLVLTRLQHSEEALHIEIDGTSASDMLVRMKHLMECNVNGMKTTDKSLWWTQRRKTNSAMDDFIGNLDAKMFGVQRGFLLGKLLAKKCRETLKRNVERVMSSVTFDASSHPNVGLLEIYLSAWKYFNEKEKCEVALQLLGGENRSTEEICQVVATFEKNHSCCCDECKADTQKRGHVILILDKEVQTLPLEGAPILFNQSVSRMPSVHCLLWQLELNNIPGHNSVDLRSLAYVINPRGDLINTEKRFNDWFSSIETWEGVTSSVPSREQYMTYISGRDVFVFLGHGSGSSFMQRELIARNRSRACALLMGCSSGRLDERGITEPDGMSLAYLISGSPCVLVCLWPVTDKDIDRYLAKCLIDWSTPGTSLPDVTRNAETACKVPKLNGSACVVYGVPVVNNAAVEGLRKNVPELFRDLLS